MRPDRVIVGEVRTPEELSALIDTILSGQARGSYATFHAQSGIEALRRMNSLGIMDIDLRSIDVLLVQRRMMKYDIKTHKMTEIRRVIEISEVEKEKSMAIKPLVKYDFEKDRWTVNYRTSALLERVRKSLGLRKTDLENELKKRTRFLKNNLRKKLQFNDSVDLIQKFAYGSKG